MFVRVKPSGRYKYLQIVENSREGKKLKQHVLCTLGRLDKLTASGQIDSIGPALVFERLWKELGIGDVIKEVGSEREY